LLVKVTYRKKFSLGTRLGRVRYEILITPVLYRGRAMKTPTRPYAAAIRVSEFMADILWTRSLAIIGYWHTPDGLRHAGYTPLLVS
jgi:hypothetical protein